MKKNQNIGIFLGSFDPVHLGHINIAKFVANLEWIDKVLLVPLLDAPHKNTIQASPNRRFKMCQLAAEDHEGIEIENAIINEKITGYDLNLIHILQNKNPNAQLHYILGSDVYLNILNWKAIDKLSNMVKFIVFIRDDKHVDQIEYISKNISAQTTTIHIKKDNLSSSMIRNCLYNHQSIEKYVNKKVLEYIKKHHLYEL